MSKGPPYAYRRNIPDDQLYPDELRELIRHLEDNLRSHKFIMRAPGLLVEATHKRLARARLLNTQPRPEA